MKNWGYWLAGFTIMIALVLMQLPTTSAQIAENRTNCDASYPDVCIPSPPPDLDCKDIPHRNFRVLKPDPHRFDGDKDGIGCETSRRKK